jgi:hypothetical protein
MASHMQADLGNHARRLIERERGDAGDLPEAERHRRPLSDCAPGEMSVAAPNENPYGVRLTSSQTVGDGVQILVYQRT